MKTFVGLSLLCSINAADTATKGEACKEAPADSTRLLAAADPKVCGADLICVGDPKKC